MGKKFLALFLTLTLVIFAPFSLSANALDPGEKSDRMQIIEKFNKLSNGNLKISEKDGQVFIRGKLSGKQSVGKESAIKFLNENKILFGIDTIADDLKVLEVEKDNLGHTYVKFAQVIDGIEVDGGLLNIHFDENGVIVSVNGGMKENKSITTLGNKEISQSEAIEIAKKQYTFNSLRNIPKVERLILTQDNINYEVFKVNISYKEPTMGNYDVFVEVHSGEVIRTENNIRFNGPTTGTGIDVLGDVKNLNLYQYKTEYQMKDLTREGTSSIETYTMNNGTSYGNLVSNDTNFFNTEAHKASVSAHYNAGKVIDFYKNLFDRNSLDNNGMIVDSYTHYGSNYNNAFWTGYEMVYGDGDGTTFTYLSGDLDVVGHEMTHGVIEHTANLYYHNQSGALNESMADIFGVLIATYDKYNVASGGAWTFNIADWVIGDDIYTPSIPGDALRSLSNPTLYGQPDHMGGYVYYPDTEAGDFGGVHTNSGIPNKAAYSVAESIGMEKTAKIYYRALVNYMSTYTDFEDAKNCLVQAAVDLYGASSAEVIAVNNAFISVGIGQVIIKSLTAVELDKTSTSLNVGETTTLLATVSPQDASNKNVTWKSSNTSVATVDSEGKVTAVGEGAAIITVTTEDGSKTASCTIAVTTPISNVVSVAYQGHVQNVGWQAYVKDGALAGTEGKSLRVEGFKIKLENAPTGLNIKYKTHVQNIGWQDWVYDGAMAGTEGQALRVEALQIMLEGTDADKYTIQYQAHVENEGWQEWVSDGEVSGSFGKSQRIEALRIKVVKKVPSVVYQGHVQNIGWQDYVKDGALSGTEGQSLRVEGFKIKLENAPAGLKIKYKTHVQNIGWQDWVYDDAMAGTEGQSLRVEALQIMLEGTDADKYTVQYQAHVENEGWQPWVSDGQVSGSFGKSQRIEALRIKTVEKQ